MIRHGRTEQKGRCIGQTDIPLCEGTEKVLKQQKKMFQKEDCEVYASPLQRTVKTAEALFEKDRIHICKDLAEINMGDWENLPFSDIKTRWPVLYEKRGRDPYRVRTQNGESMEDVADRVEGAINRISGETKKNLILVVHAGCIKALLCKMGYLEESQLLTTHIPNCSMTVFEEERGKRNLKQMGFCPHQLITEDTFIRIYKEWELPAQIVDHMEAVADYAGKLGTQLLKKGYRLDLELLEKACRLHDIARLEKNHPAAGAAWLRKQGYYEVASVVEKHHDLSREQADVINEATLLYYADKRFIGTQKVSLEERFAKSRNKCASKEALENFYRRFETAVRAERNIETAIGSVIHTV